MRTRQSARRAQLEPGRRLGRLQTRVPPAARALLLRPRRLSPSRHARHLLRRPPTFRIRTLLPYCFLPVSANWIHIHKHYLLLNCIDKLYTNDCPNYTLRYNLTCN